MTTDVLVLGSGGAALAAAVTAADAGLKVLVIERDARLGGTSAISGGALWIPMSRQAVAGGFADSIDDVRTYLRHVLGETYRPEIIEAFLDNAPKALAFLEDHTELKYNGPRAVARLLSRPARRDRRAAARSRCRSSTAGRWASISSCCARRPGA